MRVIIPAKGNSTRLPGKNMQMFNGKPLLFHAIETAYYNPCISEVIVSTDCERIKEELADLKVTVLHRPEEFEHVKDVVEYHQFEAPVLMLQVTTPLRTSKHITDFIRQYRAYKSTGSLFTVSRNGKGVELGPGLKINGAMIIFNGDPINIYPMADIDSLDIDTLEDFEEAERRVKGG